MQISLKVTKLTMEDNNVVVKFEPTLIDARDGDIVAGSIFLTTTKENQVTTVDDEVFIDYTPEVVEEIPTEETPTDLPVDPLG